MTQHVIEFDRLTQAEIQRMCKYCSTVCFRKWHTVARNDNLFAFVFEDRMDAERFIMRWSDYFSNPNTIEWCCAYLTCLWVKLECTALNNIITINTHCELLCENCETVITPPPARKTITFKHHIGASSLPTVALYVVAIHKAVHTIREWWWKPLCLLCLLYTSPSPRD